jgi:hypothetical protein
VIWGAARWLSGFKFSKSGMTVVVYLDFFVRFCFRDGGYKIV